MTPAAPLANGDGSTAEVHSAVVYLDGVEEGFSSLQFEISADELELEDRFYSFPQPFRATLEVTRASQMFTFRGRIEGLIRGDCCRCLARVEEPSDADVELILQRKEATKEELEAVAEEDLMRIVDPGTREFNLGEALRDSLAIELPIRIYCQTDCKGLCSSCGQNLNEGLCECAEETSDPRWEALAKLKQT
jgi:uncharacterized protein